MKKVALVTGITSQLGNKIAERLYEEGYFVYGSSRKKISGSNFFTNIKINIENDESCRNAYKSLARKGEHIDILVNVAGNTLVGPALEFESSDFINLLNANVVGQYRLIKTLFPLLKNAKGKIINITSLNGIVAFPNFSFYSASKFAFEALGQSLRYEFAKDGVSVTNIAPGAIKSKHENTGPMPHKTAREKFVLLRLLLPLTTTDDIAQTVISVINSNHQKAQIYVGRDIHIITILKRLLPDVIWDKIMLYIWQKK